MPQSPQCLPSPSPSDQRQRSTSFYCRFPGCDKGYASTDAVRKHARKCHPSWLLLVGDGGPTSYSRPAASHGGRNSSPIDPTDELERACSAPLMDTCMKPWQVQEQRLAVMVTMRPVVESEAWWLQQEQELSPPPQQPEGPLPPPARATASLPSTPMPPTSPQLRSPPPPSPSPRTARWQHEEEPAALTVASWCERLALPSCSSSPSPPPLARLPSGMPPPTLAPLPASPVEPPPFALPPPQPMAAGDAALSSRADSTAELLAFARLVDVLVLPPKSGRGVSASCEW